MERRDLRQRAHAGAAVIAALQGADGCTRSDCIARIAGIPVDAARRILRRLAVRGLARVAPPDAWIGSPVLRMRATLVAAPVLAPRSLTLAGQAV